MKSLKFLFFSLFLSANLLCANAAGFKGELYFTEEEKAAHNKNISIIVASARNYLEGTWKDHLDFYDKYKVSKYYGDRNVSYDTPQLRIAALKNAGASPSLENQLQPTSCIGLTLKALKAGFEAPNDPLLESAWQKISVYTKLNEQDGLALSNALQELGWKILYWNPDPLASGKWDDDEKNRKCRGDHAYNLAIVSRKSYYGNNKVDDKVMLVGFKTNVPFSFSEIPLFIGVANEGYHVFPGFKGQIIEAHSMRKLDSIDNLEKSVFNPLKSGGGPIWTQSEKYRSGIICVPPSSL